MMAIEFASALRAVWKEGYTLRHLRCDGLAGMTVGMVSVPLAMALAVASGVAPQYGLYTSIIAGALIALLGGSHFNVAGPTAAFVVILLPITQQYGLKGVLLVTFLAGILLVTLGLSGLGKYIRYIPAPVIIGFTSGIGLVIAMLQIPSLLGVALSNDSAFMTRLSNIYFAGTHFKIADTVIGLSTIAALWIWPKINRTIPSPLIALLLAGLLGLTFFHYYPDISIGTIGNTFSYTVDGITYPGIPSTPPHWIWPWELPDQGSTALPFGFHTFYTLFPLALVVALLGAIESLLCAVIADNLSNTSHSSQAELIAQGIGNIVAPFFGGITATAALARTATNIRSGAKSSLAAVFHSLTVLLIVVAFGKWFSYVPMAALSAILLVISWHLFDINKLKRTLQCSSAEEKLVLLTSLSLTFFINMIWGVLVGVMLWGVLALLKQKISRRPAHANSSNIPRAPQNATPGAKTLRLK